MVYFTSEDGYLYALDLNTQSPRWPQIKLGFLVDASPLVQNGVVYIGSSNGFLIAFDALTGAVRWQAPTGTASADNSSVANGANVKTRPVISGDTIYVTASDISDATFVYAFRVSDGSRLWRFGTLPATNSDSESAPFVADGQIYFSGNDQAVYALSI